MSATVHRIQLVESRLITERDYVDGIVPTQMWITRTGGELLRDQPCIDRPPFYDPNHSLKKTIFELIKRTETRCNPLDDTPVNPDVTTRDYPHGFSRNINCMIYEGIKNFLGMDLTDFNHYDIPEPFRFRQTFLNSRRFDRSWQSLLHNWGLVRTIHPNIQILTSNSNYALNWYMTRKLEVNIPLTTLDAFIVANCYHAHLTFYSATFENELNDWRFSSMNGYNHDPEVGNRPKWGIVFDNRTFCYYPILSDITSEMFYGYKHGEYGSLLMHTQPDARHLMK